MSFDVKRMLKREFNVGKKDQQIRLGAGVGVMVIASMIESGVLMLLGLIVMVTGLIKWCPAYSAMGKTTVQEGDTPPSF